MLSAIRGMERGAIVARKSDGRRGVRARAARGGVADRRGSRLAQAFESRGALAAIVLLAAVLRITHILALRSTLWFDNLVLDSRFFDEWAQRIAAGEWMGSRMFFVDPLYPYFLGLLYKIAGHDLLVVRLVQAAFGTGTVALTALLGRRVMGPRIGNGAALLCAVYRPAIFNEAEIEKSALAVFLLMLALVLTLRGRRGAAFVGGFVLGLAALARANILVLAVPLALYLLRAQGAWHAGRAALLVCGCAAALVPVGWRNHRVGGEWTLVTSAGQNFYQGNNPHNASGVYVALPFVRPNPEHEEGDFRAAAEASVGHAMRPGEISRYWALQAWRHMRSHPQFAARMMGRKLELLANDYEVPDNQDMYFVARYSAVLSLPLPTFVWLVPFALVGLVASYRNRDARLLAILVALYSVSVAVFFVLARYRLPMVPILALFASSGVAWLDRCVRERRLRALMVSVPCMVLAAGLCLRNPSFYNRQRDLAANWHNLGNLQMRLGRNDEALSSMESAFRLAPGSEYVLRDLGLFYLSFGRFDQAEAMLVRCVQSNPRRADAWLYLGKLYELTNRPAEASQAHARALEIDPNIREIRPP